MEARDTSSPGPGVPDRCEQSPVGTGSSPGSSRRVERALHRLAISLVPSVKLNHFESLFFVR